jgi:hypothetical protein
MKKGTFRIATADIIHATATKDRKLIASVKDLGFKNVSQVIEALEIKAGHLSGVVEFSITNEDKAKHTVRTKKY